MLRVLPEGAGELNFTVSPQRRRGAEALRQEKKGKRQSAKRKSKKRKAAPPKRFANVATGGRPDASGRSGKMRNISFHAPIPWPGFSMVADRDGNVGSARIIQTPP